MARAGERMNSALAKQGYTQLRKVGEGSFGAAILVQHRNDSDKEKAIVKMIDVSRASRQEKDDALKESQVLSQLKHPYIVRYRENFLEDGWLCIVMDYCEGGDLSDKIKKTRQQGKSFPEEQIIRWFTQSILALKYIHDLHILHRDLKSGNFFLSKSGNCKMGDFGISKVLESTAACAQTQIGTPYYLSPEICQGRPYAWGSDVWAMGCILFELCAKRVPFDGADLKGLIQRITKGPAPEVPGNYSQSLTSLVRTCLARDPAARPPASDILKMPLIQEMVRKMLGEVKAEEDFSVPAPAAGASSGNSAPSKSKPERGGSSYEGVAGTYAKGDPVEYWSDTHKEWLPATVTGVDADGKVMLNVKPNVWISHEVQGKKVRPRKALNGNVSPVAAAAAAAVPAAQQRQPSAPRPSAQAAPSPRGQAAQHNSGGRPPPSGGPGSAGAPKRSGSRDSDVRHNDDGAPLKLSAQAGHQQYYYCGRNMGVATIPGSDGRCGPSNGPQCPSCARFQQSSRSGAGIRAASPRNGALPRGGSGSREPAARGGSAGRPSTGGPGSAPGQRAGAPPSPSRAAGSPSSARVNSRGPRE